MPLERSAAHHGKHDTAASHVLPWRGSVNLEIPEQLIDLFPLAAPLTQVSRDTDDRDQRAQRDQHQQSFARAGFRGWRQRPYSNQCCHGQRNASSDAR